MKRRRGTDWKSWNWAKRPSCWGRRVSSWFLLQKHTHAQVLTKFVDFMCVYLKNEKTDLKQLGFTHWTNGPHTGNSYVSLVPKPSVALQEARGDVRISAVPSRRTEPSAL